MVTKGFFIALAAALAVPSGLAAQATEVQTSSGPVGQDGRRTPVRMMEAVLQRAVLSGAEHLAEQLGSGNPNMSFFTGQARARGFVLEGYGVFFHVEIPEMQQSLIVSVATIERDHAVADALDALHRATEQVPQGPVRAQAEQAVKRIQLLVGPVTPAIAPTLAPAPPGQMRAAEVAADRPLEPVSALVMRDPTAAYRQAIKSALIDAMLEHSRAINLDPDEWLTVAARRGDSPMSPNEIVTSPTLVLRIKGRDLALYDADRTRKQEVRARVEVREF